MTLQRNPFASKEYGFLYALFEKQTLVMGKEIVKFSQKELADECNACETTVNRWMKLLKETGCVQPVQKGKYVITPRGKEIIKTMNQIGDILKDSKA